MVSQGQFTDCYRSRMPPSRRSPVGTRKAARPPRRPSLRDDAGYLLSRGGGTATRAFNAAFERHGLRTRQYAVLAYIGEHGDSSQRRIAEALDLDPSTVVALVDDLELAGYAERKQDPADRRTRLVGATPDGARLLDLTTETISDINAKLLAPLTPDERETLLNLLRRIVGT
jgi:DNA-binding MarR family transcriptional regulator